MSQIGIQGVLEVKPCPHGEGVFSLKSLKAGELIESFRDIAITTNPSSPPWKRWALIVGKTSKGEQLFWDEEPAGSKNYWSNFLDHNNTPNVRFLLNIKQRTAKLVAVRDITAGEELFLNYKEYDAANWTPN